ncbi:MAG TPA: ATP-dependent 6-phosphofructokinase [Clostridiales bacterium]|nr:ATP-dependent 6-phosphofructokinase [Clostridiales bacterium]
MLKIAVLCSGGDSQGMNTCIHTIVNMAAVHGIKVMGVRRGYQGLIENDLIELNSDMVANIACLGGCFLKVARCKEFRTKEGVQRGYEVLKQNGIDYLIVIGGDGSYRGAIELSQLGAKVITMPGTIDNDLFYTDRTLGFDTAVNNAVSAIDDIRQTMEANNRALIVEVMGRGCGHIALNVGVAVGAHSVAVKEMDTQISDIVADVKQCLNNGIDTPPVVVVSEAVDYSVDDVRNAIEKECGIECRTSVIGYLQRGGKPTVFDRLFATQLGINAIELINKDIYNVALGIRNNNIFYMKLEDVYALKDEFNKLLFRQLRNLHNLSDYKRN